MPRPRDRIAGVVLVPFALAVDGAPVHASAASRQGTYVCPGCRSRLILRAGNIRRRHFAHAHGFAGHGESELHRLAKHRLEQLLEALPEGKRHFFLPEPCERCGRPVRRRLPAFARVELEYRMPFGRIADAALLSEDGQLVCVIEIFVTNRVDPRRAAAPGIPWLEVGVLDPIDDTKWRVKAGWPRLRYVICRLVARKIPRSAVLPVVAAKAPHVRPTRVNQYQVELVRCRACGATSRYFTWRGTDPPESRPSSLRLDRVDLPAQPDRLTLFTPDQLEDRQRWWNHCGACDALLDP